MWVFTLRSLNGEPREYTISTETTTIGRRSDNDIVISEPSASRYHAEILYDAAKDELAIKDLGSTNGTSVNRVRITDSHRLTHNDIVRIGENVLNVRRQGTNEKLALVPSGTHVLTRDVMLESIDQHAVLMYEVAQKLNTVMRVDAALQEVSGLMKRSLGADRCEVITADKFDLLNDLGFPVTISQRAIELTATVNIPDIEQEQGQFGVSASLYHIRSVLCVPVMSGDQVIGLIYMYKIDPVERPSDQRDLQLAIAISHQAALTLERMSLLEKVKEEQRVRQLLQQFVAFDYEPLREGQRIPVGKTSLELLHVPGHTLGNLAVRVGDFLLSGDSLFVESIARPDLGGKAEAWAPLLYASLMRDVTASSRDGGAAGPFQRYHDSG